MAEATSLSVLLVDDESGVRELVKRYLNNPRFQIVEAENGQQALELIGDAGQLDLLITDELMSEMRGHELSRRLRAANPNLKVLYLTGYSDRLFDAKQQMWDLEAYLDKPFSADGLRQAVALLMVGRLSF